VQDPRDRLTAAWKEFFHSLSAAQPLARRTGKEATAMKRIDQRFTTTLRKSPAKGGWTYVVFVHGDGRRRGRR
jgi:hypothetical protein